MAIGSQISTYFRVCDGVRVRFADNKADSDVHDASSSAVARKPLGFPPHLGPAVPQVGRVVAIDLPGFGHSDGRPGADRPGRHGSVPGPHDRRMGPGAPHVVGPDVGTAAALFLAAKAPELVTSLTIGGGAVRFPIEAGGALKEIIEAPSLDVVRALDAGPVSATRSRPVPRASASLKSTRTMSALTTSGGSRSRLASCGTTPNRTRCCATYCRRSPRRPRSWRARRRPRAMVEQPVPRRPPPQ